MKFAICQELFEGWDWKKQCQFIAQTGYTGIEVAPFTLAKRITDVSADQRRELRKMAEDHGLAIIGLHWLLAKTEGLHLTTADAAVRTATAVYIAELGKACADMGGTVLVFGSPGQRNLEAGTSREQALDRAAEVFRQAVPVFADRGVKLCMEPLTPKETNFINSCDEAAELIGRVDHPAFMLHQDVKAMLGEPRPQPLPELIQKYARLTGHFHVNDSNLLGPGMGPTDYTPILKALVDSGYPGWVSVEVFDYSRGAEKIARDSLHYMQKVLSQLEVAAVSA